MTFRDRANWLLLTKEKKKVMHQNHNHLIYSPVVGGKRDAGKKIILSSHKSKLFSTGYNCREDESKYLGITSIRNVPQCPRKQRKKEVKDIVRCAM